MLAQNYLFALENDLCVQLAVLDSSSNLALTAIAQVAGL